MHFDDIMSMVLENFPTAELGEDNDGQLIIYTGLKGTTGDMWHPIEEKEVTDENCMGV